MRDVSLEPQVEAATGYDEFFVPALFEEWAPRVAEAARITAGDRVLDVACGTGVLAREVRRRAGPNGLIVGLDLNPGMLAVAARREPDITWREGAAESIPYDDSSFDKVVSQFGLMFFSDARRALREMWRVLVRGGMLAVAVWDSLDNTPAYAAEVELLRRTVGEHAANVLRAPFSLGDPDKLRALVNEAGIPSPILSTHRGKGRFPSAKAMVNADINAWLPLAGVELDEQQREAILAEAEGAFRRYIKSDGMVEFASSAHIVTARKA